MRHEAKSGSVWPINPAIAESHEEFGAGNLGLWYNIRIRRFSRYQVQDRVRDGDLLFDSVLCRHGGKRCSQVMSEVLREHVVAVPFVEAPRFHNTGF